jgi:hypothetical protein
LCGGLLQNISDGGMCFTTERELQSETVLKVYLPVTDAAPTAPTLGQVIWVKKRPRARKYRVGIRFVL